MTNDPQLTGPEDERKTLNVEKMIKRILRSFRKNLKDLFLAKYTKQFYRWDYATIREKTKEFFMEPIIGCSEEYYD